jgi:hypothetical protein
MKKKIFFLIFAIGGVLLLASLFQWTKQGKNEQTASLKQSAETGQTVSSYSFYKDDDLDRLSNAKEIIYGSLADAPDTDGDGYLDGEEVENGYDPIVAGSAKLKERANLSVTIKYFLWLQEKQNIKDPKIENSLINKFLEDQPEVLKINYIDKNEIKFISQDDKEAVRAYLAELNKISLPEGMISYKEIARSYSQDTISLLEDILGKIELAYLDFTYLKTPLSAGKIQQGYLTIIREFSNIFSDLKFYRQDPVKIEVNLKKAQKLIELSEEIEKEKLELIKKFKIS